MSRAWTPALEHHSPIRLEIGLVEYKGTRWWNIVAVQWDAVGEGARINQKAVSRPVGNG